MTFSHRGFTLIELLVVIAIIGILSSVVLTSLSTAKLKAQDAQRASNLTEIRKALELYYDANGHYPIQSANWGSECSGWAPASPVAQDQVIPGLVPTYLPRLPEDPAMNLASSHNCILYRTDATGKDYKVLDYNMTSYSNPAAGGTTFIDPARNSGQSWAVSGCSSPSSAVSLAIWSSAATMCW